MAHIPNIIHIEENGASTPYFIQEKVSAFCSVGKTFPEHIKVVPYQVNGREYLLLCTKIEDATWEDIPADAPPPPKKVRKMRVPKKKPDPKKLGTNVDVKA